MAKKVGVKCPNCGSDLYEGHDNVAPGNVACIDNDDPPNGCLSAWNLAEIKGIEAAVAEPPVVETHDDGV